MNEMMVKTQKSALAVFLIIAPRELRHLAINDHIRRKGVARFVLLLVTLAIHGLRSYQLIDGLQNALQVVENEE